MKQFYLYRLFKYSTPAFIVVILFLVWYSVVFYKKMDMIFFPYNSMYAIDFTKNNTASTYAMKLNGNRINITHQLYWKKDFLETTLSGYCKYLKHDRKVFMDDYINQKFKRVEVRNILLNRLTPEILSAMKWPQWYAAFAGYPARSKATVELMEYHFLFDKGQAILTDSISIYKTTLP
jgi:c-di-AMP phosphodiesterase-like protein